MADGPSSATVTEFQMEPLQNSIPAWVRRTYALPTDGVDDDTAYFTVQHSIYTASGRAQSTNVDPPQPQPQPPPPLLPHSQLCSCVDEREQTFITISVSSPHVSALQKHIAAVAPLGRPHMLLQGGRAREKRNVKKREENLESASRV